MKMKLPSLFKNKEIAAATTMQNNQFQWPSCKQPKTLSFRAGDDMFKTVNSVFFDTSDSVETPKAESWFTNSASESASFTTSESEEITDSVEVIIRGARSERLFFEPNDTSSILMEETTKREEEDLRLPFKESVALAMESEDPYVDFRRSMEEMVESHGLKDWECLEELLGWYLKMNGKKNHGFIVGAFVDLLVGLSPPVSSCCSDDHDSSPTSYSSAASSFSSSSSSSSSSPLSVLSQKEIEQEEEKMVMS